MSAAAMLMTGSQGTEYAGEVAQSNVKPPQRGIPPLRVRQYASHCRAGCVAQTFPSWR